MTDLEITKLCAEAMGIKISFTSAKTHFFVYHPMEEVLPLFKAYAPLYDDEQAMALVKKFHLYIYPRGPEPRQYTEWQVSIQSGISGFAADLNRAICECVAKTQQVR